MKLNLPNRTATAKPATSLADKAKKHTFSLPKARPQSHPRPTETSTETIAAVADDALNAVAKSSENLAPEIEISDEKFNIVPGAIAGLTKEAAEKFRDMLVMLADVIDNESELQNVLRGTLLHLQENPEVDAILTPEDRAVFVRAARKSYGITLVAKTTRKTKTTKAAKQVDDLMDELADLDFAL